MARMEDEVRRFYAEDAPPADPATKRQVIKMVAREAQKESRTSAIEAMPFWRFTLTQMRFINPVCWVLQIALVACVLIAGSECRTWNVQAPLVMTFAVLTVAVAIPSLFKSLESRTSELELACRFDCAQVLAARLIIFGLADVLWLSIVVAVMPSFAQSDPFGIFLYASTPFFAFCALCFYLARVANRHVAKATIAAATVAVVALWQSTDLLPCWYSELSWGTWLAALACAVALAAFELRRLVGDMSFAVVGRHPAGA